MVIVVTEMLGVDGFDDDDDDTSPLFPRHKTRNTSLEKEKDR